MQTYIVTEHQLLAIQEAAKRANWEPANVIIQIVQQIVQQPVQPPGDPTDQG